MAVMNINPISMAQAPVSVTPAVQPKQALSVNRPSGGIEKTLDAARNELSKRAELNTRDKAAAREYGPIISRSSDGDTVRVKASASDQAKAYENAPTYEIPRMSIRSFDAARDFHEYGFIEEKIQDFELPEKKPEFKEFEFPEEVKDNFAKETTYTPSVDIPAPKATEASKASQADASLSGVSDAELKRKYLQGDISQVAYNNEIEARDAREETLKAENDKISKEITGDAALASENARSGEAIEALGSEDASDNIPVDIRAQFAQVMDEMGS